jgi:hypothetical protein
MSRNLEDKLVFAVAPAPDGGAPLIIIGLPTGAWEHMKDGKTENLDLTRIGLPFKLMMFGAENHSAAMKVLNDFMAASGVPYLDKRNEDFTLKPRGTSP